MKNENTNLNKDEYLIVSYEHILDYIWIIESLNIMKIIITLCTLF